MHVITEDDIKNKRLSSEIHSKKIINQMIKLDDTNINEFDILIVDVEGKEHEVYHQILCKFQLGAKLI